MDGKTSEQELTPALNTRINNVETKSAYLNQDVKTTASPSFAKVTVTTAPSAGSDLTNKTYVDAEIAKAKNYAP